GDAAEHAAWLIAQHAAGDPAFQERCLALLLEQSASEVCPHHAAYLEDRINALAGRPQRYGTQLIERDGALVPAPLADEAKDGEPRVSRIQHRLDDEELRDEADGRRDPGERDEEDREGERPERLAAREAVELVERRAARPLEVDVQEAGEGAEVHDSVREDVEEHGGRGGGTGGRGRDGRED